MPLSKQMQSGSLIGQSLEMDYHTYAAPHVTTKTVVVKEAYTEQVLVSEGHWE